MPIVEYEGQIYNTIQIFSQCWLKENINVGVMIMGDEEMINNDTIEKYCYNNSLDSCTVYGGIYRWNEMMQYVTQEGAQGICPPDWHIPTDDEWKILEGTVDSQYGIGDSIWELIGWRGFDAGINLKSTSGWYSNGNGADLFGFTGLPGGWYYTGGDFTNIKMSANWWTSTESSIEDVWNRFLEFNWPNVIRFGNSPKEYGQYVRCLKD